MLQATQGGNVKNSKYCQMTACCWAFRHELLGIVLLVIAALLTIITFNSFGIVAMFLVGGVLCCYRHVCHISHGNAHCISEEMDLDVMPLEKSQNKPVVKKTTVKVKK